jgi:hypothetical protein
MRTKGEEKLGLGRKKKKKKKKKVKDGLLTLTGPN